MPQFDMALLILAVLGVVCYFSGNNTVTIAILILIIFKLSPLATYFPVLNKKGLTIGIILLTAAVMVPIADGTIGVKEIYKTLLSWKGILSIVIGVAVAWFGHRGVVLLKTEPTIITGLIIGTLVGVSFFKGVPVGPLIAAGMLSLFISKI